LSLCQRMQVAALGQRHKVFRSPNPELGVMTWGVHHSVSLSFHSADSPLIPVYSLSTKQPCCTKVLSNTALEDLCQPTRSRLQIWPPAYWLRDLEAAAAI
jgi:hypothetical protein